MGRGGRGGFSIINKKLSERQLNFKASFWAGERSCELFCPHKWIFLYCIALAGRQASDRAKARRHAKALPLMLSSPLRSSCLFPSHKPQLQMCFRLAQTPQKTVVNFFLFGQWITYDMGEERKKSQWIYFQRLLRTLPQTWMHFTGACIRERKRASEALTLL
jgi:hypothetical protein